MEVLENRLRSRRTECERKIQDRLRAAKLEIAEAKKFDAQIVNTDFDQSFQELCELVEREVGLAE